MNQNNYKYWGFLICCLFLAQVGFGQDHLTITGVITDANTGEPLPFSTVLFVGNESVGTTTDYDGTYILDSKWGTDSIQASYVGYHPKTVAINKAEKKQVVNFQLREEGFTLETAEVTAKKQKYKRTAPKSCSFETFHALHNDVEKKSAKKWINTNEL